MSVIIKGNEDGSFVDMDELLERIAYKTTKQSVQFSLRALINRNMINKQEREKRRGRRRAVFSATRMGYHMMKG